MNISEAIGHVLKGEDLDAEVDERATVNCEVNQLLTAVRSPVAPVDQEKCPGLWRKVNAPTSHEIELQLGEGVVRVQLATIGLGHDGISPLITWAETAAAPEPRAGQGRPWSRAR